MKPVISCQLHESLSNYEIISSNSHLMLCGNAVMTFSSSKIMIISINEKTAQIKGYYIVVVV